VKSNEVIRTMMEHRSVRSYTSQMPDDETIETIVRAGQQAPFAYQIYSVILSRAMKTNPFKAPLLFTICVDMHKFERIMEKRGWKRFTNDLTTVLFGVEDASYMAQNMVVAGQSLGLGSCFLGAPLGHPTPLVKRYKLPKGVYPIVQLAMGFPAEEDPVRPRYPLEFVMFEDRYPELSDDMVERAMKTMDLGYMDQGYYSSRGLMIPLPEGREETHDFDTYGWTEHISRKLGLWGGSLDEQREVIKRCGFNI
jgi:FMN reductase (NADPH)